MFSIEKARKEKNISQEEIAKYLWITRQTFSKIEKWEKSLTLWQAVKISEFLGLEINDILQTDTKVESKKEIDLEKYGQIITNFIKYWTDSKGKITKTKLAKFCYLLDFSWYYFNLEPLTGLEYKKYKYWPVPDKYFVVLENLFEDKEISIEIKWWAFLIENIENPKTDKLNEDELELLKKIAEKWKDKTTQEIVDFTHSQLPWFVSYDMEVIPYWLITQEDLENVY